MECAARHWNAREPLTLDRARRRWAVRCVWACSVLGLGLGAALWLRYWPDYKTGNLELDLWLHDVRADWVGHAPERPVSAS